MRAFLILSVFLLSCCFFLHSQEDSAHETAEGPEPEPSETDSLTDREKWVKGVMDTMSLDEKIGQLFMVAAYSNRGDHHKESIDFLIRKYHIGGLIFFQGGPGRQAKLTNAYQEQSRIPLLIGIDGEWGLGMRLDSTMSFPRQMTLGAMQSNDLIYDMGKEIARQSKRLGIHINFAPVVDVNVNRNNPVIGYRAFGEHKINVAAKGIAYMKGMQDQHVLATAKHFPGHGDTDSDSHYTLPVIHHSRERLKDIELYPFERLIADSVGGVMVAHIHIPALDNTENLATTLSPKVVTGLLKEEMGYKGLIFTDALNMHGVSDYFPKGEVELKALLAGNDVLLFPTSVPKAVEKIKAALRDGTITMATIEDRVSKILTTKYWSGLHDYSPIETDSLYEDLNSPKAKALRHDLYEKAMTVVKNEQDLLPVEELDTTTFASVAVSSHEENAFQQYLSKYTSFEHHAVRGNSAAQYSDIIDKVKEKDIVVVGIHDVGRKASTNYNIPQQSVEMIKTLQQHTKVITVVFGQPYALGLFDDARQLICAYEDHPETRRIAPQLIFGAIGANGRLPVTASEQIKAGMGEQIKPLGRLGYAYPENEGLNTAILENIDTIVSHAIEHKATPGAQVLVARHGKVIYEKAYGHFTYDEKHPVNSTTVYDIASVTKVAATMQAVMKLTEEGKLDLDETLETYFPEVEGTNKEGLKIRDVLIHQAGLKSFIQFWRFTLDEENNLSTKYYCFQEGDSIYCNPVSPGIYSHKAINDTVWQWIIDSEMIKKDRKTGEYPYNYSDLGFYIMKRLVEKRAGMPMKAYLEEQFYRPLGMNYLTFLPLQKYAETCIAPTEQDALFRHNLVCGTVHDPGAALMGGVAGHAGLFTNANDLAKLLQMNLNNGTYGGKKYFKEETVPMFTAKQKEENRRGLGWDKVQPEGRGPTGELASPNTFGHSGFTGTGVWVDKDYDLMYIFLSNRVYPDAENAILLKTDVRTRIHDMIYQSIQEHKTFLF